MNVNIDTFVVRSTEYSVSTAETAKSHRRRATAAVPRPPYHHLNCKSNGSIRVLKHDIISGMGEIKMDKVCILGLISIMSQLKQRSILQRRGHIVGNITCAGGIYYLSTVKGNKNICNGRRLRFSMREGISKKEKNVTARKKSEQAQDIASIVICEGLRRSKILILEAYILYYDDVVHWELTKELYEGLQDPFFSQYIGQLGYHQTALAKYQNLHSPKQQLFSLDYLSIGVTKSSKFMLKKTAEVSDNRAVTIYKMKC
ncbi:FASCICLIN-like arabinogalactan 1 [Striga asiatica]|uniref:FASCICLIN-like arabinogalactan 1 n=1 Tax=Striga asiatica TaxID=4170 RepID=A0A5A7PLP7_STRAF|nr:FASCICLIN-like arabinogalactan 1 [Striga asiatica]